MTEPYEPRILEIAQYTEATHTVYADVAGCASLPAGDRRFTPGRITVKYNWRTQLGDVGWKIGNIEVSGRWVDEDQHPGSGMLILGMGNAPAWACAVARDNMPTSTLVGWEPQ